MPAIHFLLMRIPGRFFHIQDPSKKHHTVNNHFKEVMMSEVSPRVIMKEQIRKAKTTESITDKNNTNTDESKRKLPFNRRRNTEQKCDKQHIQFESVATVCYAYCTVIFHV